MFKLIIYTTKLIILSLLIFSKLALADRKIIENGNILVKKLYSEREETMVVNDADKIYVCSVVDNKSECILSKYILD